MAKEKKSSGIIWIVIIILLLSGLGAAIRFNAGGITDSVFRDLLKDVPIAKNILPKAQTDSKYEFYSREELINEIDSLEVRKLSLEEENKKLQLENSQKDEQIKVLESFKNQQETFRENKEEFDNMVLNQNKEDFSKFYKEAYPEIAEKVYKEVAKVELYNDEMKKYATSYGEMEPENAAGILEKMMITDIDLVVDILKSVDSVQRAEILSNMKVENASRISKRMAPKE